MNRRGFLLGGATLLSALPLPGRAGAQERVLKIAYPDKSPPSSWQNEDHRLQGLMVDLMVEVAAATGYSLKPVPLPLPRVQLEVESGAADGMCLIVTPARLEYAVPCPEPLVTGPITMFVRRDSPALARLEQVRSLDDLAKADVTVVAFTGNGWIRKNIESRGIRTEHASGTIGTVRMLLGGRGDVVIDMSSQINWILKTMPEAADIIELPTVIERVDWHLMISKRSPVVHDVMSFNEAIKALKASSRYADTLRKYDIRA